MSDERGLQPRIRHVAAAARASVSCVVAVAMLAWCPREHTRDPHVEDDRVQQEGALQPRLVPLRVHEGGVHGPVQKLLVEQDAVDVLEQDAVDVLHCGSTQKTAVWTRR